MIRRATREDAPTVIRLAGRFLLESSYGRLFAFDPEALEQLTARILEVGVIFVCEQVAIDPEDLEVFTPRLVGFLAAVVGREPYSRQEYADEVAFYVEPEARRGTVGPRLKRAFEQWARDKNCAFCKMVAPAEVDSDLAGFLQRDGYAPLETSFVKRLI